MLTPRSASPFWEYLEPGGVPLSRDSFADTASVSRTAWQVLKEGGRFKVLPKGMPLARSVDRSENASGNFQKSLPPLPPRGRVVKVVEAVSKKLPSVHVFRGSASRPCPVRIVSTF